MSDFDEYFADDFILDDTAIAVLDAEEHKFKQSQQHPRPLQPVPPPKRQKTELGWKHPRHESQADSLYDDLPEISIHNDGSYGLLGIQNTFPNTLGSQTAPRRTAPSQSRPNSVNSTSKPASVGPSNPVYNHSTSHDKRREPSNLSQSSSSGKGSSQRNRGPIRLSSQNHGSNLQKKQSGPFISAQPAPQRTSRSYVPDQTIADDVSILRLQLEQLNKSHEEMRQALKAAQDAQFSKEGEVSILRKGMEKTTKEHAADLAKLRAAKEAAEASKSQVQKEMRDEIERMKTQFTFKQHELETSVRKPPWPIRGKKTSKDVPSTPLHARWDQPDFPIGEPSTVKHTPSRSRFARGSPETRRAVLPSQGKLSGMLPGFVNAFQASSPIKSQENRHSTVKAVDMNNATMKDRVNDKILPAQSPNKPTPQSSPTVSQYEAMDARMGDHVEGNNGGIFDKYNEPGEDLDEVEPINWATEIHHVIFTHVSPSATTSTVQSLMSIAFPLSAPDWAKDLFSAASSELWTILSNVTTFDRLRINQLYSRVAHSLTKIVRVLNIVQSLPALTAVLGLLKTLICFISSFCGPLLSTDDDADPEESLIVTVLCDVIRCQLTPPTTGKTNSKMTLKQRQRQLDPDQTSLAEETLGLFEALCWSAPDGLEMRLITLVRGDGILDILLDDRQPSWLLYRAVRGLVFFACRSNLYRHVLSFPRSADDQENDYSRIPHIERLCGYLADNSRKSSEAEMARNGILTLISTLYVAHADARTILLESEMLIPSLVSRLTHLTSLLWEDDEQLMSSPELTNSTSHSLCQTLFLLHDLVFNTQPQFDLKQKIQNASPASGIDHMFNVTLGRLTYAPDLVWVTEETSQYLAQVTDTAREILQVVVDSAEEEDMIYTAYQEEEPDDEEMEAMQLEANDL